MLSHLKLTPARGGCRRGCDAGVGLVQLDPAPSSVGCVEMTPLRARTGQHPRREAVKVALSTANRHPMSPAK
eukprot:3045850-Rhodomonas_salina.1